MRLRSCKCVKIVMIPVKRERKIPTRFNEQNGIIIMHCTTRGVEESLLEIKNRMGINIAVKLD